MAILTTVRNDVLPFSTDLALGADDQGTGGNGDHGGGPVASNGDSEGGEEACHHGYGSDSGSHEARPVPTFWNFVENEIEHAHGHANNNHHQFQLTRHHA